MSQQNPQQSQSLESEIRDLAYSKWEAAGCPSTTIEERNHFWLEAEKQILEKPKVEMLPGAQNLGEVDDAEYFKNKLLVKS